MVHVVSLAALVVFLYMSAVFLVALARKNNGVVDIAWGAGFILVSAVIFLNSGHGRARRWLALALVLIWGGRLALHIYQRNRGKEEDFRYAAWRRAWGKYFVLRSFFQIFMLQGLLMLLVATPLLLIVGQEQPPLNLLDGLGVLVWLTGFLFETVGDRQLARIHQGPGQPRQADDRRLVERYAPPQLLRRGRPVVGHGRHRPLRSPWLAGPGRPGGHHLSSAFRLRRAAAREEVPRPPRLGGVQTAHVQVLPLVPQEIIELGVRCKA